MMTRIALLAASLWPVGSPGLTSTMFDMNRSVDLHKQHPSWDRQVKSLLKYSDSSFCSIFLATLWLYATIILSITQPIVLYVLWCFRRPWFCRALQLVGTADNGFRYTERIWTAQPTHRRCPYKWLQP
jgi:hypothetical protein